MNDYPKDGPHTGKWVVGSQARTEYYLVGMMVSEVNYKVYPDGDLDRPRQWGEDAVRLSIVERSVGCCGECEQRCPYDDYLCHECRRALTQTQ